MIALEMIGAGLGACLVFNAIWISFVVWKELRR